MLGKLQSGTLRRDVLALRQVEHTAYRACDVSHFHQDTRFVVAPWFAFRRNIDEAASIDHEIWGVHNAPLAEGVAVFSAQALIVGTPGNNVTLETWDGVVVERATQRARRIDFAGDIVNLLGCHHASAVLLGKSLRF